jgi:hypothetical protein
MSLWPSLRQKYSSVPVNETDAAISDEKNEEVLIEGSRHRVKVLYYAFTCVNFIILLLNIWVLSLNRTPAAAAPTSVHSSEQHSFQLHEERWRLILGEVSPFTAPPSPEVDALWEDISADGPSTSSLARSQARTDQANP